MGKQHAVRKKRHERQSLYSHCIPEPWHWHRPLSGGRWATMPGHLCRVPCAVCRVTCLVHNAAWRPNHQVLHLLAQDGKLAALQAYALTARNMHARKHAHSCYRHTHACTRGVKGHAGRHTGSLHAMSVHDHDHAHAAAHGHTAAHGHGHGHACMALCAPPFMCTVH